MSLRNLANLCNLPKICVISIVKFYHNNISQYMLCQCRYYPSCSEYTVSAVKHRGVFLGLLKGISRILRCNPLFPGGYDPVERRKDG